ncbi:Nif11-like leader peptide family RiPP precursor [bacterium AH-315-F18]|nr:Nif11-like leader peptide family RiPP precursor [bacterium AH-315-F18]
MSLEDLKAYAAKVSNDDALKAKAKEVGLENTDGQIALAKELGFTWTTADMDALAKEGGAGKGELSDEQLESVSGGFTGVPGYTAVVVAAAAAGQGGAGAGW